MSELTNEQIAAGAAVIGDDGKPVGRNVAIMVADAISAAQPVAASAAGLEGLTRDRITEIGLSLRLQAFENAAFRKSRGSSMTESETDEFRSQIDFARAIEREVLATQSAKQGALKSSEKPSLNDLARLFFDGYQNRKEVTLSTESCGKLYAAMTTPPVDSTTQKSVEQDPVAQEVTQQAAKADTAEQAFLLVQKLSCISMRLAADLVQGACYTFKGHDYLDRDFVCERVVQWRTEWDATMPDRSELASRFRAQGGNTNAESSDLAPTTSTVSASGNSSKNSSSSEGDQAAVDDVRNQALEEAVEAADAAYLSAQCSIERGEFSQPIRQTREAIEAAIRALRTTPTAAQAAADKSED